MCEASNVKHPSALTGVSILALFVLSGAVSHAMESHGLKFGAELVRAIAALVIVRVIVR